MLKDVWNTAFLFDAEGDAGGGSSAAAAGSGDEDPNVGTDDEGKAAGGGDEPAPDHPRFKEIYSELKDFKNVVGDMKPAELSQALSELREFYAIVNEPAKEPDKQEPPTKDEADKAKLREGAIKELEELSPGITQAYQRVDSTFKALSRKADRATTTIMKDAKYDEDDREWLSKTFIDIINKKDDLWDDYITGDVKSAIQGAWKVLQERLRVQQDSDKRADKLRAAKTASRLPRTLPPGGRGELQGGKEPTKPKTLKEAQASAQAKLDAAED